MFQPQPHGDVAIDPLRTDDIRAAALSTTLVQFEGTLPARPPLACPYVHGIVCFFVEMSG
jgi:hypothetical protein